MKRIGNLFLAVLLSCWGVVAHASTRDDAVAEVIVDSQTVASGVMYVYQVTNKGERSILGVRIGYDYYRANPELGGGFPTLTAPPGWVGRVITTEEMATFQVAWDGDDGGTIPPGEARVFTLVAPQASPAYNSGHWTVIFDGAPTTASSLLRTGTVAGGGDTVPPQITVHLTPESIWPPNNKMVPVTATVTATDDRGGIPVVRLVSITCNECADPQADIADAAIGTDDRSFSVRASRTGKRKDGRVYTVTYSATDAAGNQATASATVVVPHDQR